jgi:uncharacterized protein YbbC (DUF1343 family)
MVTLGIEQLVVGGGPDITGKRLGLLSNQASTDRLYRHSRDLINRHFPGQLTCLFSPQHGFFAEKQDNMIESNHDRDGSTELPIFSLYGEVRKPTPAMLDHLDVLLIDLNDVGTRVYTFIYTVAYCLQAAKECGKQVVVLDRPNPIGGELMEGNLLRKGFETFVGLYPLPMRHGMTVGELARLFNGRFGIGADFTVVPMAGWRRGMLFPETGLPFVFPSPNMPTFLTASVYPGQVLWEGTNVSEGRGTTLPFELFGTPFFETEAILDSLRTEDLAGCLLRPLAFEPTSNKWQGSPCHGFQLHITDFSLYRPYRTSLALLQSVMLLYPEKFAFKPPPYEYEYELLPIDCILGDDKIRKDLADGVPIEDLEAGWQQDLKDFADLRRPFLLYD